MEIIERVKEIIADYLEGNNIELVEIAYRRRQGDMVLKLLVDKRGGITADECEGLNKFLSDALDREDIMVGRYVLEVSSPGLDRPITTDRDFERSMGKVLDITTYESVDGKKAHEGRLVGMDKDNIVIESNGISTVIPKGRIARARLKIEF